MKLVIYLFSFLLSLGALAQRDSSDFVNENEIEMNEIESEVQSRGESKEDKKSRASQKSQKDEDEDMEKISVVGSHIRRLDVEGPSPVYIITKEAIEKSGYNLVGSLLRDSTLAPYGGRPDQISVRGLGSENTLVLVNGKRLPKKGGFYGSRAPSLNTLPTSAIERVEILTDGASAIYGSEALASVINIITRKDLNGMSASAKLSVTGPRGSDVLRTSLTYGQSSSRGRLSTSFDYLHSTPLFAKDLSYTNPESLKVHVFSDNYSTPGINKGKLTAFDSCRERNEWGWCTQYHGHIDRFQDGPTVANFSELSYRIYPDLTFKSDVMARYSRWASYRPAVMNLNYAQGEGAPFMSLQQKGFREKDSFTIIHRIKGLETRSMNQEYTFGANIGLEGDVGYEDWIWSLNNHAANYKTVQNSNNMVLKDASKRAMRMGQFDPFNSTINNTSSMLHDPDSKTNYFLNILELAADGILVEVGEINLSMAVGLQFGYYAYKETGDPQVVNGNISDLQGVSGSGDRLQQSAYAELGALFAGWIEAQLATRFDHYSDFGSTVNPKLALKVQPIRELMFRGSVGTGFKAPELADVNMGLVQDYSYLKDEPKCAEDSQKQNKKSPYCNKRLYRVETGGHPDLQEETSFSYNIELGIEPISNIHFSIGYWYYKLNNVISRGDHVEEALRLQAREGLKSEDYGVQIIRDDNGEDDIDRIIARNTNLGVSEMDGLDLKAHVHWGSSSFDVDYSMVLMDRDTYFKDYGFQSQLGDYGRPRYRFTVTYNQNFPGDQFSFQIKRRTSGSYKDEESTSDPSQSGKIPSHSQYDVFFRWNQAPFNGELTVGAINALNSLPKLDPNASPRVNTALYRGFATYYVGYKARF